MEYFALLQLLLLYFPGIVALKFYMYFISSQSIKWFDQVLYVFMIGTISYLFLEFIYKFFSAEVSIPILSIFGDISKLNKYLANGADEIIFAIIISLLFTFLIVYVDRRRWLFKLLYKVGLSRKFGENHVWDYLHNSENENLTNIRLSDLDARLRYEGDVEAYSSSENFRELLLNNVTVYNLDTEKLLYTTASLYLSLPTDKIRMEFPRIKDED